jgi:hypothetical protein
MRAYATGVCSVAHLNSGAIKALFRRYQGSIQALLMRGLRYWRVQLRSPQELLMRGLRYWRY